ncbi:MAG: hypothetical protein MUD17_02540 [Gemmatimonadaceae bacterium]|nr:hypothetical protein [Gemmatimonadaceae bacterium]
MVFFAVVLADFTADFAADFAAGFAALFVADAPEDRVVFFATFLIAMDSVQLGVVDRQRVDLHAEFLGEETDVLTRDRAVQVVQCALHDGLEDAESGGGGVVQGEQVAPGVRREAPALVGALDAKRRPRKLHDAWGRARRILAHEAREDFINFVPSQSSGRQILLDVPDICVGGEVRTKRGKHLIPTIGHRGS